MRKLLPLITLLLLTHVLFAQQKRIKGKVLDTLTREPIESAVITDIKTKIKTGTDKNGNFTLDNVKGDSFCVLTSFITDIQIKVK